MEFKYKGWISPVSISTGLSGMTKEEILQELVGLLEKSGKVTDRKKLLDDIHERERVACTLVLNGIAIPHAKTCGVSELCTAIGIRQPGVVLEGSDKNPVSVFVLVAWPSDTPGCLKRIAALTDFLSNRISVQRIIASKNSEELYEYSQAVLQRSE